MGRMHVSAPLQQLGVILSLQGGVIYVKLLFAVLCYGLFLSVAILNVTYCATDH